MDRVEGYSVQLAGLLAEVLPSGTMGGTGQVWLDIYARPMHVDRGTAIPVWAWTGFEGSRRMRLPDI